MRIGKESDAKRGVQGNDLFIVLKAEILGGKLYGICRMMDVHVHGKALGTRVIRALDLDGNEIAFALDDEINLRTALRFPIIGGISVDGELHLYIVFSHAAFEIVQLIDRVENIVCVQILLGAEQAQIGYIDFESVDISIVFQRLFDLFDAIDLGNNAGQTKPFDGIFKLGCASAFLDEFVLEARILLGELHSDVVVGEPRFLDYAEELINADNFAEIKGWLLVKYINSVAKYLSQKFREASFPFAHAISGIPELPSQIKQDFNRKQY